MSLHETIQLHQKLLEELRREESWDIMEWGCTFARAGPVYYSSKKYKWQMHAELLLRLQLSLMHDLALSIASLVTTLTYVWSHNLDYFCMLSHSRLSYACNLTHVLTFAIMDGTRSDLQFNGMGVSFHDATSSLSEKGKSKVLVTSNVGIFTVTNCKYADVDISSPMLGLGKIVYIVGIVSLAIAFVVAKLCNWWLWIFPHYIIYDIRIYNCYCLDGKYDLAYCF